MPIDFGKKQFTKNRSCVTPQAHSVKNLVPLQARLSPNRFLDQSKRKASDVTVGQWQEHLQNRGLSQENLVKRVTVSAKVLENKAIRNQSKNNTQQDPDSVDALLIDAVKAKLAVLDKIN